jgi:hypothetical protein
MKYVRPFPERMLQSWPKLTLILVVLAIVVGMVLWPL